MTSRFFRFLFFRSALRGEAGSDRARRSPNAPHVNDCGLYDATMPWRCALSKAMPAIPFALLLCASLFTPLAHAEDATLEICFNYGCATRRPVTFDASRLNALAQTLQLAQNAEDERARLSVVVGKLYALAAEQTPIGSDKGGNYADAEGRGRMDCIDHATTTTAFLRLLEERGALRWHKALPPVRRLRFWLLQHFSALIEEQAMEKQKYVVDSWFVDNGEAAIILPLEDWEKGEGPDV